MTITFGKILTAVREERDLTRKELANKLNISYSTLSKYETDERFPSQEMLLKIADYFDVSTDYLLGRSKISKFFYIPDLLLQISEEYNIDYMDLLDLAGHIERGEPEIQVYEFDALEKGMNDMINYFISKKIAEDIVKLSNKSQEDLNNYIELLKLRDEKFTKG